MPKNKWRNDIIDKIEQDISNDVGNTVENEINIISQDFTRSLLDALSAFNSSTFDDDGFIKKMRDYDPGTKQDKDMVKNVLNNIRADYMNADILNQSELLLRRDISNICSQMPEIRDSINILRDAIIECNVSTGEVSRTISFENHDKTDELATICKDIEKRHNIQMAIKNFIVPNTLMSGELYINVVPYKKLFAELEIISGNKLIKDNNDNRSYKESYVKHMESSFKKPTSLYSEENLKVLMESVSPITKVDSSDDIKIEQNVTNNRIQNPDNVAKSNMSSLLNNINVFNGSSILFAENGESAFRELLVSDYKRSHPKKKNINSHFLEAMDIHVGTNGLFNNIDQDDIDVKSYSDIKGCYVKYLNSLKIAPIRLDRKVIGYYYITTTVDLQTTSSQPNGIVDLSYQHYTKDRNLVSQLAEMIIKSFDKKVLDKNIKLKNEIAEIIMAHKFSEGKLSFIYIPENEIIRLVINEDEEGKGHSILEPTLFPSRMYTMLDLYNMLYTLNNNTTRIHYLKSSGLNKDYAAQIQRTMRKFQQRRITVDDIYSYSGVLNKVGGMGELVLPAGRNDYKALETDTIPAVEKPIDIEFLEQKRRQSISGTGIPYLMSTNMVDEVDFAKTMELANARFLSTVSSYKIDFNKGITKFYQVLFKYETDMKDEEIQSFRFKFNAVKQQDLAITSDMIQNFNNLVELVQSIYYTKSDLEDDKGNPTPKAIHLRKELAMEYIAQLDFDRLDEMINKVEIDSTDDELQSSVNKLNIDNGDLDELK